MQVTLDSEHFELHLANIMVASKFIVELDPQTHQSEGMNSILRKLSDLAQTYMR